MYTVHLTSFTGRKFSRPSRDTLKAAIEDFNAQINEHSEFKIVKIVYKRAARPESANGTPAVTAAPEPAKAS